MMSGSPKLGLADAIFLNNDHTISLQSFVVNPRHTGLWQFGIACVLSTLFDIGRSTGKGNKIDLSDPRATSDLGGDQPAPATTNLLVVFPPF